MIADPAIQRELDTADSRLTRGFELGYVIAKCESRASFACRVLSSQVETLCAILAQAGASVKLREPEKRRYTVSWTPMEVEFR